MTPSRRCLLLAGFAATFGIAVPVYAQPRPYAEIPPLREEFVPPSPGRRMSWQPGHWHWNGRAYVWNRGFYVRHARQRRWVHGEWVMRRGGWIWIPARWH